MDLTKFDPAGRDDGGDIHRDFTPDGQVLALMIAQDYQRKGLREATLAMCGIRDLTPQGKDRLLLLVVGKDRPGRYQALASRKGTTDRLLYAGATRTRRLLPSGGLLRPAHPPRPVQPRRPGSTDDGRAGHQHRFNGACEIMTDGVHGFVLNDPEDVPALAGAMAGMLLDPDRRRAMRAACLALASSFRRIGTSIAC